MALYIQFLLAINGNFIHKQYAVKSQFCIPHQVIPANFWTFQMQMLLYFIYL